MARTVITMWRLTVAAMMVVSAAPAWCLTNLLPNASMEADENGDGVADGWSMEVHRGEGAEGSLAIDTEIRHSGNASLRIEHTSDNQAWVRASVEPIDAKPDALYRVDAWVRGSGHYTVLLYQFIKGQPKYLSETIASGDATDEWQSVSKVVTTDPGVSHFKLSLISNGKGVVWFDDASLVLIAEKPNLRAPRTAAALEIDGRLDEAAWERAAVADEFMILGGDGEPAPVLTRANVCFDDEALYVGFECQEPNVAGMKRDATQDGAAVWADDCVEVFLDTQHDRAGYLHLGVSATGFKWQDRRLGSQWYTDWYSTGGGEAGAPAWTAAAQVGEQSWTAELRLPFGEIGGAPRLGKLWGANFCRTRRATGQEENFTWSYTPGERYAVPDRFGTLAFAARPSRPLVAMGRPADYRPPRPRVIPQPQALKWRGDPFRPNRQTKILPLEQADVIAAQMLQRDMTRRFGLELAIEVGQRGNDNAIIIGNGDELKTPPLKAEGYRLVIGPRRVEVLGADARGAFYGAQTLRQMLVEDGKGPLLYGCDVTDWPDNAWRGWHLSSPSQADLALYRRFIDFMALLKYNTLCLEVDGQLQYDSHPKIAREGSPTKDELRELVAYARQRHFEIFPQLASFSHVRYVTTVPEYRHLAEAEKTTLGFRDLNNYCPSNPETYEVFFGLMDELIAVFGSKYFHIGHDEATFDDIGTCPRCKGKDPSDLFVGDVTKLHDHLAQKGVTTLMWGDMFLPTQNGGKLYKCMRGTDKAPKDIIICDWHYSPDHDNDASLQYFQDHGFRVLGSPWYEPLNVWNWGRQVKEHGVLGYFGTTWSGLANDVTRLPHVAVAWTIGAENCWSVERPSIAELPYQPVPMFNRLWNLGRAPAPKGFKLVDLAPFCNESTVDTERRSNWMGLGPEYDLRNLPTGRTWIGDTPFELVDPAKNAGRSCVMVADESTPPDVYPESVWEIPIGQRARAIRFLHTCSVPKKRVRALYDRNHDRPTRVGWYTITYADGSQVKADLLYLANISDWNSQTGPVQALDLWQGKTQAGSLATLAVWEWENPNPKLEVSSVSMTSARAAVRPVLLGVTVAP